MVAVQRGLLVLMAAGALALPSHVPIGSDSGGAPVKKDGTVVQYDASQKEAYLTAEQLEFVRPGLKFQIIAITDLAPGKKPTVELKMMDELNQPLDRTGGTTPGVVGVRFVVSTWDEAARSYKNVIIAANGNPTRDTTGTFQDIAVGHYKYTFFNVLGTFDVNKPMTVVLSGRRAPYSDVLTKEYWAIPVYKDLIPATGAAASVWAKTVLPKCNACHDPLALHGENYRDIKQCAMCHNPLNMTGNLAEFNGQHFWHAIHSGNSPEIGPITFPFDRRNCDGCHEKSAPMGNVYYTYPNRAACTGCHIDVNFATGAGHTAQNLPQADDSQCASCHIPQGDAEFDASILGAHTQPAESKQLKGLNLRILSATNVGPGKKPTVTFDIKENDGKFLAPNTPGLSISILLGGTTADYYRQPFSESATLAAYNASTGVATYTFTNAIPADAKGTWTFSAQSRRTVALQTADGGTISYQEGAVNPIFYAAVTGTTVTPRRTVVTLEKCNVCHDRLATLFSHGGQRIAIGECLMCHNPNATDANRRPADHSADPAETYNFSRMIHKIHSGEALTQEYTIYDRNGNPVNFNEVTYPSDRRNCLKCHANAATYDLPVPSGTINVVTLRDWFTPQGPGTGACLACHDTRDAAAHAYLNTSPFGEACGTCHGAGSDWNVEKVHAR